MGSATLEAAAKQLDALIGKVEAYKPKGGAGGAAAGDKKAGGKAAAAGAPAPAPAEAGDGGGSKKLTKAERAALKKAGKAEKAAAGGAAPGGEEKPPEVQSFEKAHLAVGKVVEAKADDAWSDKLYLCQVDCGNGETRQVVTGLRKHVPQAQLEGATVALILNLKKAKLAGQESAAMILACESDGKVTLVAPPAGAAPGTRIHLEGGAADSAFTKELKTKIWDEIKAELKAKGGLATFHGTPLVAGGGRLSADGADGSPIK